LGGEGAHSRRRAPATSRWHGIRDAAQQRRRTEIHRHCDGQHSAISMSRSSGGDEETRIGADLFSRVPRLGPPTPRRETLQIIEARPESYCSFHLRLRCSLLRAVVINCPSCNLIYRDGSFGPSSTTNHSISRDAAEINCCIPFPRHEYDPGSLSSRIFRDGLSSLSTSIRPQKPAKGSRRLCPRKKVYSP
jgi:hypothetical protein